MFSFWLYRSLATKPALSPDDVLVYFQSLNRNYAEHITGLLHRTPTHYIQYVEGQEGRIARLAKTIAADRRHKDIETLAWGETEERRFRSWDMSLDPAGTEEFELFQKAGGRSESAGTASAADLLSFIDEKAAARAAQRQVPMLASLSVSV